MKHSLHVIHQIFQECIYPRVGVGEYSIMRFLLANGDPQGMIWIVSIFSNHLDKPMGNNAVKKTLHLICIDYVDVNVQSPKNPLVRWYLQIQNEQGRIIFLTPLSGRTSDNKTDFIFLNFRCGFLAISLCLSYKILSRDPNFNDEEPRFTLSDRGIE